MPFSVTRPANYVTISAGHIVRCQTMCSGAPTSLALHGVPPEYVLHEERAVDLECFALTHLITRHLTIPDECLSFVLQPSCMRGLCSLTINIVFQGLSEEAWERLCFLPNGEDRECCYICTTPCTEVPSWEESGKNCCRCHPSNLCELCKIHFPCGVHGWFVCYHCLEQAEISNISKVSEIHMLRINLLLFERHVV